MVSDVIGLMDHLSAIIGLSLAMSHPGRIMRLEAPPTAPLDEERCHG